MRPSQKWNVAKCIVISSKHNPSSVKMKNTILPITSHFTTEMIGLSTVEKKTEYKLSISLSAKKKQNLNNGGNPIKTK